MKKVNDSMLKLLDYSGVCKAAAKYATMILPNLDAKSASWHITEQRSDGCESFYGKSLVSLVETVTRELELELRKSEVTAVSATR